MSLKYEPASEPLTMITRTRLGPQEFPTIQAVVVPKELSSMQLIMTVFSPRSAPPLEMVIPTNAMSV